MSEAVTYQSVTTDDGFTVSTNTATSEAMTANFAPPETEPANEPEADTPATEAVEEGATREAAPVTEPVDPILAQNEDGSFKQKAKKGSHDELRQRIAKATWEREEAKRETAQLKTRLAALESAQTKPPVQEPSTPEAPQGDPEPTVDQFETYEKFVKAQARWEARQEMIAFAEAQQKQAAAKIQQDSIVRVEVAGTKAYPDFKEKLSAVAAAGLIFPPILTDAILDPENSSGYALAYEYATHLDDLRRLSEMAPGKAALIIGKTLARLETPHSGSVSKPPVLSQAKAPFQPVGSSPNADADEPSDDEPLERHILRYNAADRKAGRR
jgi:hypothetical protein